MGVFIGCMLSWMEQTSRRKFTIVAVVTAVALVTLWRLNNVKSTDNVAASAYHGLTLDDIVAVVPTDESRRELVRVGRFWRQGIRTVVVTNDSKTSPPEDAALYNETWTFYPDFGLERGNYYPGDSRAALAPLIAHRALQGQYKWLLYGDDDTLFFVEGVLRLVNKYDASLPYFITDNLWFIHGNLALHPNLAAPRCLPCHVGPGKSTDLIQKAWGFKPPVGCPCTTQSLCGNNTRDLIPKMCGPSQVTLDGGPYSLHGGAGAIMSQPLWQGINATEFQECVHAAGGAVRFKRRVDCTGGDAYISHCLWAAGFGPTDPGVAVTEDGPRAFDPGNVYSSEDWTNGALDLMYNLSAAYTGSGCDNDCEEMLEHVVSTHIHVQVKGLEPAIQQMELLPPLYRAWHNMRLCQEGAGCPQTPPQPHSQPLQVVFRSERTKLP